MKREHFCFYGAIWMVSMKSDFQKKHSKVRLNFKGLLADWRKILIHWSGSNMNAGIPGAAKNIEKVPILKLICENTVGRSRTVVIGRPATGSSREATNSQGTTCFASVHPAQAGSSNSLSPVHKMLGKGVFATRISYINCPCVKLGTNSPHATTPTCFQAILWKRNYRHP